MGLLLNSHGHQYLNIPRRQATTALSRPCRHVVWALHSGVVPLRRRYSYSAVGLNFLTSAVVMLEAIVCIGLVQQVMSGPKR